MLYPFRREAKLPTLVQGTTASPTNDRPHHGPLDVRRRIHDPQHQRPELKKKADLAVAELAKCQDARGDGFCGGFPPENIFKCPAEPPPAGATSPPSPAPRCPPCQATERWRPLVLPSQDLRGLTRYHVLTGNQQALKC